MTKPILTDADMTEPTSQFAVGDQFSTDPDAHVVMEAAPETLTVYDGEEIIVDLGRDRNGDHTMDIHTSKGIVRISADCLGRILDGKSPVVAHD